MIKAIGPEEASNMFQGESDHDKLFGDFMLYNYRNFIKLISRKLKIKINTVIFRLFKFSFRGLWNILAEDFPEISFKVCKDDDSNW